VVSYQHAYNRKGPKERGEGGPGVLRSLSEKDISLPEQGIQVQTPQRNHSSAIEETREAPVQLLDIRPCRLRPPDRMVHLNEYRPLQGD